MSDPITRAEVQQIRQKTLFHGPVTRTDITRLCESWLALDAARTERGGDE